MLFACDTSQIGNAVDYVRDELKKRRVRPAGIARAMLAAEEITYTPKNEEVSS